MTNDTQDFPTRITAQMAAMEEAHKASIHDLREELTAPRLATEMAIEELTRKQSAQTATIKALRAQVDAFEFRLRSVEAQMEQQRGDNK